MDNIEVNGMSKHIRMPTNVFLLQTYLLRINSKEFFYLKVFDSNAVEVKVFVELFVLVMDIVYKFKHLVSLTCRLGNPNQRCNDQILRLSNRA